MADPHRPGMPPRVWQARYAAKMRRRGLRPILVWVPRERVHDLKAVACLLRCLADRPMRYEMPTESRRPDAERLHAEALRRFPAKDAESPAATHPAPAE